MKDNVVEIDKAKKENSNINAEQAKIIQADMEHRVLDLVHIAHLNGALEDLKRLVVNMIVKTLRDIAKEKNYADGELKFLRDCINHKELLEELIENITNISKLANSNTR